MCDNDTSSLIVLCNSPPTRHKATPRAHPVASVTVPVALVTRYPKRHAEKKHYEEDVISDEDEYLCTFSQTIKS